MRPVPVIARSQLGLFTAAQAVAAGWTHHALRHAVTHGNLERLRTGVFGVPLPAGADQYADATAELRRQAVAVALVNPSVVMTGRAAAALLGLPLVSVTSGVCVTAGRGRRGDIVGTHRHRGTFRSADVRRLGPALLFGAARTVVDLGREHGPEDMIAAADAALRQGQTTPAGLAEAAGFCRGWSNTSALARIVPLAGPESESVLESISKLRIADAGLPRPQQQTTIRNLSGRFLGRCDFYWPEYGVVGEADGMAKYDDAPLALRAEKVRQADLEDAGLIVVRWSWLDLDDFAPTAARLAAAFRRAARPDRTPRAWLADPPTVLRTA